MQVSLKPASWQELRERLTRGEDGAGASWMPPSTEHEADVARLSRIRKVYSPLNARRHLLEKLHTLGDVRVLPESASGEMNGRAGESVTEAKVTQEKRMVESKPPP
ncbi:MAG: hypothetical protein MZV70_65840 [Desulfobacterales bacterium]|nr:hypothetical protein [Desulfobacterales bacterium]